jgi:hypothetical protein
MHDLMTVLPTLDQAHMASLASVAVSATALRAIVRLVDSVHEAIHNIRRRNQ